MIGRKISHYKILERLGGGGMGVVYKAQDTKLDRLVALKFLSDQLQTHQHQQRFLQEARAASALDHPNICTIHEIGETEEGQLFISMGYYEGQTLREKIERKELSGDEVLAIANQIMNGLAKAHEHGIVHRDIKPANIIVTRDHLVKILDFGLAKLAGEARITTRGTAVGTVAYMSPEQARGEDVDHRTDIWSMGVLLYEMFSGRLPFNGQQEQVVIHAILNTEPESILRWCAAMPSEAAALIHKALSKSPSQRYSSIREMSRALQLTQITQSPTRTVKVSVSTGPKPQLQRSSERRQVTVVVSNLIGYSELIEHLSPEETETFLRQLEDTAHRTAQVHGGMINQFSGEQIVSLFGIPATHEDDCIRGIRFSLEMHSYMREHSSEIGNRIGQPVRLQTGAGTGLSVTEPVAGEEKYRVSGNPIQHASHLAAQAGADEVWVSSECRRLLEPYFDTEICDPVLLKGKTQSVTPYRIVKESGLHTRFEAAERTGLTHFTGRESELKTLQDCLDAATRGEGQFVTVVGEAGIGKSRLLYEFRSVLGHLPVRIVQARCEAHRSNVSYFPFIEALRGILQINESSLPEEVITRIRGIDPGLQDFTGIYFHLLAFRQDQYALPEHLQGEDLRLAIREAFSAIFTMSANRDALVLILEDLHWADDASKEVLKQLAEMASACRLLLIVTYRPETSVKIGFPSNRVSLYLTPLDPSLSMKIIRSCLDVEDFPEDLGKMIHDSTGGNPFFLEEVCHTLKEEGRIRLQDRRAFLAGSLDQFRLPESIDAVIRTRLDRLEFADQELLRLASVVGREFSRNVVQRMVGKEYSPLESLERLKTLGLIQQIRVVPEAIYRFKHALTQQVVYESLLQHRRKNLHGAAGAAIEELYSGRVEEYVDILAFHFSQAEEWQKAVYYISQAAQKAEKLGRFSEALEMLEKAHHWLLKLPDDSNRSEKLIENLLQQERLGETLGEREKQRLIIEELLSLVHASKDPMKMVEAYRRQGDLFTLLGRFEPAEEALQKAITISKGISNIAAERTALRSMGFLRWHQGNNAQAVAINETVLAMDRQMGDEQSIPGDLINLGNALRHLGDHGRALKCLEEALEIYEMHSDPVKHASAWHIVGNIYRDTGDNEKALDCLKRAAELSGKNQIFVQLPFHLMSMGNIYLQQSKVDESLKLHREAFELNKRIKHADGLAQSHRIVGEILSGLNQQHEALGHFLDGADLFSQLSDIKSEARMRRNAAGILEQQARNFEALANWKRIAELSRQLQDSTGELEALEGTARLSRLIGDSPEKSLEYYAEALRVAERDGLLSKASGILNSMGILEWNRGDYQQALGYYEKALRIFEGLEDLVHQGLLRNSLGATLLRLERYDEALEHLQRALEYNGRTNERLLEAHTWSTLGDLWSRKGDNAQAVKCYQSSLGLRRQIGDRRGEGWVLYHLARLFAILEMQEEFEAYSDESKLVAAECGDRKLQEALLSLKI